MLVKMTNEYVGRVAQFEAENFTEPWSQEAFAKLSVDENAYYVLYIEGTEVIGMCGLYLGMFEGSISNVAVKKEYRERGIAKILLKNALEYGKERGVNEFTLEVRASNVAAIALYKSAGFCNEGIRKNFYSHPTEDAMIMWIRNAEYIKSDN